LIDQLTELIYWSIFFRCSWWASSSFKWRGDFWNHWLSLQEATGQKYM